MLFKNNLLTSICLRVSVWAPIPFSDSKHDGMQNEDGIYSHCNPHVLPRSPPTSTRSKRHHRRSFLQKYGLCHGALQKNIQLPWQEHLFLTSEHLYQLCRSLNGFWRCHTRWNAQGTQPRAVGASWPARTHPKTLSAPQWEHHTEWIAETGPGHGPLHGPAVWGAEYVWGPDQGVFQCWHQKRRLWQHKRGYPPHQWVCQAQDAWQSDRDDFQPGFSDQTHVNQHHFLPG